MDRGQLRVFLETGALVRSRAVESPTPLAEDSAPAQTPAKGDRGDLTPIDDSDVEESTREEDGQPVACEYVVSFADPEPSPEPPSLSVVRSSSSLRAAGVAPRSLWRKVETLLQERTTQVRRECAAGSS